MSSESALRLRSTSINRRASRRPPQPSSPSSRRRTPPTTPRKLITLLEPIDILHKCSSEPLLPGTTSGAGDNCGILDSDGPLYRPMTCSDVLSPSHPLLSPERSHSSHMVYQEDSKVVVTVTVEGSPGPIRTMVKLGSSVEEAIKLVIDRYGMEGRSPSLDKDAASQYELHLSYFSLESLPRTSTIGDVGSRNFYLRKRTSDQSLRALATETFSAEVVPPGQPCPLLHYLPAYISQKLSKFMRRMCMLWKMLGCLHGS